MSKLTLRLPTSIDPNVKEVINVQKLKVKKCSRSIYGNYFQGLWGYPIIILIGLIAVSVNLQHSEKISNVQ